MSNALVSSLSSAIAMMENANPTNNNPGNIMDLAYYKATKQYKPATYSSPEEGQAALNSLIGNYIGSGLTLEQFTAKYAPAGHGNNDPTNYANFISQQTGIPLGVPLNTIAATSITAATSTTPSAFVGPTLSMLDSSLPITASTTAATEVDSGMSLDAFLGDGNTTTLAALASSDSFSPTEILLAVAVAGVVLVLVAGKKGKYSYEKY